MFSLSKVRFPTLRGVVALILAIGLVGGFLGTQGVSAHSTTSNLLWSAVGTHSSVSTVLPAANIEASRSLTINWTAGDTAILSSTADGLGAIATDNFITVNGVNVCVLGDAIPVVGGTNCYTGGRWGTRYPL
jgi:hypothetical protein